MAKIKSRKKLIAITTAALLVAGGSSAAFAYWTSTGAGIGSAKTGTTVQFTVSSVTSGDALVPGGDAQTVTYTVANSGDAPQRLTTVEAAILTATGGVWAVGSCNAEDYTITQPVLAAPVEIAAKSSTTGTFTIQMVNNPTKNQDDCKGALVPLAITAG